MLNIFRFCAAPGLFRLLLALIVFVHHTTRLGIGQAAVFIFFILSGFWISTMWIHRYSKTKNAYITYIISRIWRLLPVFVLCSAISWGMLLYRDSIPHFTESFVRQLVSNIFIFGYSSLLFQANVPAWSLESLLQNYRRNQAPIFKFMRIRWHCTSINALNFAKPP
jgi:peptidoglycan/LPS O-acetylase OafA/YrhL